MIKVQGAKELMHQFDAMQKEADNSLSKGVNTWTDFVRDEAARLCPVDTGALQRSIQSNVDENTGGDVVGEVFSDLGYADDVEFGTEDTPPQPFLFPALSNNEGTVLKGIEDTMKKAIKGGA